MPTRLAEEEIRHPANEALLTEATEIKEERTLIKERLERLESTRNGVSPSVYQRVRSDYVDRLNKAMERLLGLKKQLEEEQKSLVQKKILIDEALRKGKETIEESSLRHKLGEFSNQDHERTIREETQELGRLEGAAGEVTTALDRYSKIFEGEEFFKPSPQPRPAAPPPPPTPPAPVAPPAALPEASEPGTMKFRETDLKVSDVTGPGKSVQAIPQIVVMEAGKVIQTVVVDHPLQIGRSPANDIVLKEAKVSRRHAEVQIAAGKYILLDLESANGTFVAGKKITEHVLRPNEEIKIGGSVLVFKV